MLSIFDEMRKSMVRLDDDGGETWPPYARDISSPTQLGHLQTDNEPGRSAECHHRRWYHSDHAVVPVVAL